MASTLCAKPRCCGRGAGDDVVRIAAQGPDAQGELAFLRGGGDDGNKVGDGEPEDEESGAAGKGNEHLPEGAVGLEVAEADGGDDVAGEVETRPEIGGLAGVGRDDGALGPGENEAPTEPEHRAPEQERAADREQPRAGDPAAAAGILSAALIVSDEDALADPTGQAGGEGAGAFEKGGPQQVDDGEDDQGDAEQCRENAHGEVDELGGDEREVDGLDQGIEGIAAVVTEAIEKEGRGGVDAAAHAAGDIFLNAGGIIVGGELKGDMVGVQCEIAGVGYQMFLLELLGMLKQEVVHLPEFALGCGSFGGLGGEPRLGMELGEREVAKGESKDVAVAGLDLFNDSEGGAAMGALVIAVLDELDFGSGRPLHMVSQRIERGLEGRLGRCSKLHSALLTKKGIRALGGCRRHPD